jgi:hypothetical protein
MPIIGYSGKSNKSDRGSLTSHVHGVLVLLALIHSLIIFSTKKYLMFLRRADSSGTHLSSQPLQHHHPGKGLSVFVIASCILLLVLANTASAHLTVLDGPNGNTLTITVSYTGNYVLTVDDGMQESSYYAQEPQSMYYTLRRDSEHIFSLHSIENDELVLLKQVSYKKSENLEQEAIDDTTQQQRQENQLIINEETLRVVDSKGNELSFRAAIKDKNTKETIRSIISQGKEQDDSGYALQDPDYEDTPIMEGMRYDMSIIFDSGPVDGIEIRDIMLQGTLTLGIDEIDIISIGKAISSPIRAYAIDPELMNFDHGIVTSTAQGHLLWKCEEWNFAGSECEGTWKPIKRITPGEEYSFIITPDDPGYMETGLSIVNTDMDNYYPGEMVWLTIAVLDNEGYLVSDADINITVISPNNETYAFGSYSGSVKETRHGVYTSSFPNTNAEGMYGIMIATQSNNHSTTFSSWFQVSQIIPYRIIRQSPSAIDPWQGSFYSAYRIISYSEEVFSYNEKIPKEANITGGDYDEIIEFEEHYEVVWHELFNNTIVGLHVQAPQTSPDIMMLGPSKIIKGVKDVYIEARPWFIALDPTAFYDPTRTITNGWNSGTGTTHTEIDDGIRQPNTPNTADYVSSQAGSGQSSSFGFNNITESGVSSITLWVYTGTGTNAQYTFSLLQGTTSRCATDVAANSATQWMSCTWSGVTGDLSDVRLLLGAPTRSGGGALQYAFVYAAYVEIAYDEPPVVTLNSPSDNGQINSMPALFNFTVIDDANSILPSCSLYGNFTGLWALNQTIANVANGTWRNFSIASIDDMPYVWNVQCTDSGGNSAFALYNRTVKVNVNAPSITEVAFNETTILQGQMIRLNATITDYYGISSAISTIRLPNGTLRNNTMTSLGEEHYLLFDDTILEGTYNLTRIFANDTLGQESNYYPALLFQVTVQAPTPFDLTSPPNNTISTSLVPNLTWTQTESHGFKNYTIQLDKDHNFGSPDYTYFVSSISRTWYHVDFALDTNSRYYWRVIAYDTFGNSRISYSTFVYVTDNQNPIVALNSPDNNGYSISSLTQFNYTPSDANGIASCTLYGNFTGSWQSNETSSLITNGTINSLSITLSEGIYLWNVQCTDNAGNKAFATTNRTVIVDLSGPVIALTNPSNNSFIGDTNTITFNASAQDAYSDLKQCSLLINGTLDQTINGVSNGVGFSFNTFLLNGYYYWQVNCTDIHGFQGVSDSFFLDIEVVDNDPPFITLNAPANNSYLSDTSVTFTYTPQDSTGILSCSLYINETLNQTDYSVTNLEQNSFSVSGLGEDLYSWKVLCIDSALEENEGISSTYYFIVDTKSPEVVLNYPENGDITNISPVIFSATDTDSNLGYCQLYTNRSGLWAMESQNNTVISQIPFTLSALISNEIILWNVLCYDMAGNSAFAPHNRTLTHDSLPPKYSAQSSSPESPATYSESTTHFFNATWTDEIGVHIVLFESNFSGVFANATPSYLGNDDYSFNYTALVPGIYRYRWHAIDTAGNYNTTGFSGYEVVRESSSIQLVLNSISNNLTVNESELVNITATLQTPSAGILELLINGTIFSSGSTPLTDIRQYDAPGYYNITARYNETQNHSGTTTTLFLTVQDITPPVVTLISPGDNGMVAEGIILFQFNVSDKSTLQSCSLYIGSSFDQTRTDVITEKIESFTKELDAGDYEWQVSCEDAWGNIGNSSIYNFSAIDTDEIIVTLHTSAHDYERGETADIDVRTTDVFGNPLKTTIVSDFIYRDTNMPWWNTAWKQRRVLEINETTGSAIDAYVEMNITTSGINSCQNHLRIIDKETIPTEVPYLFIAGNDATWCFVGFEAGLSAYETADNRFFAYYNTTSPSNPGYSVDYSLWQNYYATVAAADEGTPADATNIIGNNDATFARMTQGGGAGTHSAHGRGFITGNPLGTVTAVYARYRYAVPSMCAACTWELRHSVNDGTSYSNAFTGAGTTALTTSTWVTLTSSYSSLTWSSVNGTRLQGRMTKTGGGGTGTLDLYWVEVNVTYRKAPDTNQAASGIVQAFITRKSEETDNQGEKEISFSTSGLELGTYSIVSVASAESFTDSSGYVTFDVSPDITPPIVSLVSPEDFAEFGTGQRNMTFNITDLNPQICTLYFGSGTTSWGVNATISTPNNNQYTFQNIYFGLGIWEWNVLCYDSEGNSAFAPQNHTLNITGPDLTFGEPALWLSNDEKIEGTELTIYANVTNIGLSDANEPFNVSFYRGDPDNGGIQIGNNQTINALMIGETGTVSTVFLLEAGVNRIFAYIDRADVINESDESNNKANITIAVEIYHYYYGNITAEILLSNANNKTVIDYSSFEDVFGHIIAASSDAVFSFSDLIAIGRNTQGNAVNNDFSDIDTVLGTSTAPDSINNVWAGGSDVPLHTTTFNIGQYVINNVPYVNSTNANSFITGILWDSADDTGNLQYDTADKEDLIFISKINMSQSGAYGTYDYEIRVPAALRGNDNKIAFYVELE